MSRLESRAQSFSQISLEHGLHQASALAAMTLLITAHRAVMNSGFTLRRKGFSTDTRVSVAIGSITSIWTLLVLISAIVVGEQPCRKGFEQCAARLSYVPWIMQVLFFFWIIGFMNEICYLCWKAKTRAGNVDTTTAPAVTASMQPKRSTPSTTTSEETGDQIDLEARTPRFSAERRMVLYISIWKHLRIWKLECSQGPRNWSGSISRGFRWSLNCIISSIVVVVSYAAIRQKLYTVSLLNLVGVALFIVGAAGANKYATAPHIYTADTLRIMLHTRHREGTCFILPCDTTGFDAVWGPKIEYENRLLDEAMDQAEVEQAGRDTGTRYLINMDKVLAAFNSSTDLDIEDVVHIAGWLYEPERHPKMQKIVCKRMAEYHLINKSIIDALWHAEYLVFMRMGHLPDNLKKFAGTLRSRRGTGLDLDSKHRQIGAKPGLQGYQEAVRYVYRLFNERVDQNALVPNSQPPKRSCILSPCPTSIDEYFAQLWEYCFEKHESTFAALSAFLAYRTEDIGNDVQNGWGPFPLRAWDREGDIISWHVVWRQAWYSAVIAQLTSMSPIILSAFLAGILQ
ncbi:uncharacterized protein A1O9_11108 [Exophiala aquamarina CBS 119918]|uniref:Uncharacterized protein n=1 Tax=Exophiala aquamarina CBS 119918 TaxID=1182545 RepID=A0A072NYP1_9EURO|nr:uncharacterized protein A1O9_11108 [Exophiala aquamarina CBS 119918]KEF52691.1 hypothetical protein A1O9_11108 [Exophiala aquamarina CBS 119918]